MGTTGMTGTTRTMGTTGTRLTLHTEEGPCRVLPGAVARPACVVPLVGGLHGAEA